jgi:FKBP-type peptidyl-prolyl cis-trans isomerase
VIRHHVERLLAYPPTITGYTKMKIAIALLLALAAIDSLSALSWRRKKQKKRAKEGWRRTKKGWERLNLPPDSKLQVGVTYRPKHCSAKSQKGDFISIHYNGTLFTNGNVFDSSILREYPFVFQLGKRTMHDGFEKGLLGMCVGEKRKLVVPSGMAYGKVGGFGSEGKIKPNATLVYGVELLEILSEEAAAPDMVWGL